MYKIIENYLPQKQADEIESVMINPPKPIDPAPVFPWFYMPHFFTHVFYERRGMEEDKLFKGINNTILARLEKEDMKDMDLLRVRANLHLKNPQPVFAEPLSADHFINQKVAIYYVNTNNGYTLLDEKIKIPSIKNSVLIFDGEQHKAVSQTDENVRVIINIYYQPRRSITSTY